MTIQHAHDGIKNRFNIDHNISMKRDGFAKIICKISKDGIRSKMRSIRASSLSARGDAKKESTETPKGLQNPGKTSAQNLKNISLG